MGLFAGKTKSERNKLIAAAALGLVALVVLYLAFGRGLFGGSASATTKTTPTPTPKLTAAPAGNKPDAVLPSRDEQEFTYQTTMVDYRPSGFGAPDPGRNIFSFVEPPPPCKKDCPTPTPKPTATPVPPTPTPTPVF